MRNPEPGTLPRRQAGRNSEQIKIVIDDKIPFIKGVLEPYAEVVYLNGSEIGKDNLIDADALIIRTRTHVNSELLEGTPLKFVGTATIGTDHIDLDWCNKNNIHLASAPGCNSGSVMQYIAASLAYLHKEYRIRPSDTTLGVIGIGNVGSKVAKLASTLGYKVLINDPPREEAEGSKGFSTLNNILQESDIISIHVPLTKEGKYPTALMVNDVFLKKTRKGSVIINTSRGQVVDEPALIKYLNKNHIRTAILDVWDNEPDLNINLLNKVDIGTPHIAGYSVDGKAKGSSMIINQLSSFFDLPLNNWSPENLPQPNTSEIEIENIVDTILSTYPIIEDSDLLKASPEEFEELRGSYRIRREFAYYKIKGNNNRVVEALKDIGFRGNS